MKGEIQSHVLSIIAGILASLLSFWLSTLAPPSLQNQAIGLSIIIGLTTTVIYDRIYLAQRLDDISSSIVRTLRTGDQYKTGYTIYKTERQAISYLVQMIPRATMIKNTRLSGSTARKLLGYGKDVVGNFDKSIISAVMLGADLRFVCDKEDPEGLETLKDELKAAQKRETSGGAILYLVDFRDSPVLQMIILNYPDGSAEALVGWELAGDASTNAAVMAFRDPPIVAVFDAIFDKYTTRAKPQPL